MAVWAVHKELEGTAKVSAGADEIKTRGRRRDRHVHGDTYCPRAGRQRAVG